MIHPTQTLKRSPFIAYLPTGFRQTVLALTFISLLAGPTIATSLAQTKPSDERAFIEVKVLVFNNDPIVLPRTKLRLHEHGRWNDPRKLAPEYISDVAKASNNYIRYKIVEWNDLDEFPIKEDGHRYTIEEYVKCHKANKGWHEPDRADYPKFIEAQKIVPRIESGEIDEVWWFGAPYFGTYESAMAGKGAFYINGGVFDKVPCKRAFAIMGFNYERGPAEMIHNLSHRTESTMSRIFGGWKAEELTSDWARFAANAKQSKGIAAVGNCHYPPNGESDYDYGNKRFVESNADGWLTYPKVKPGKQPINCETWGGPDYQRNYLRWWFAHLPRAAGVHPEHGRRNNWWEYVFNFNAYDEKGMPIKIASPNDVKKE